MTGRLRVFAFLLPLALAASSDQPPRRPEPDRSSLDHQAWVGDALKRMLTVKPGMTRKTLLSVFTTEGGLSTGVHRTYVSRDCAYFKVDVDFQPVGRPERDHDGRITLVEDERDTILKISRPYLAFTVAD